MRYSFQKLQSATSSGGTAKPNEDGLAITRSRIGMFDGATGRTKDGRRFLPQSTEGSDAAWLVAQAIKYIQNTTLPEGDLRDQIRTLATDLKAMFEQQSQHYPDTEKSEVPSAAMAMATIQDDRIQIAGLFDVQTIVTMTDGTFAHFPADSRAIKIDQANACKILEYYAQTHDMAEALRLSTPFIREQLAYVNTPGQPGVLNVWDTPLDECFAYHASLNAQDVARIIIWTDGVDDRYQLFTPGDLVRMATAGLYQQLIGMIRAAEFADRDCFCHPRTKISDDATIIAVQVVPEP